MPRPQLPPDHVKLDMPILLNPTIGAEPKITFACLKALAWGQGDENSVTFTAAQFQELFGIPRTTLYRHLALLKNNTEVRFRSTCRETFQVWGLSSPTFGTVVPEMGLVPDLGLLSPPPVFNTDSIYEERGGGGSPKSGTSPKNGTEKADPRAQTAERILFGATGGKLMTYPATDKRAQAEKVVLAYYDRCEQDEAAAIEALKPFWAAWLDYRTRENMPPSLTNLAWLTEWAATGEIPPRVRSQSEKRRRKAQDDTGLDTRKALAESLLQEVPQ